jgi:predicted metalloprotease
MRLDNMRESQNVEDRRGRRGPGGRTMVGGGLGIGGIILVLVFVLPGGKRDSSM